MDRAKLIRLERRLTSLLEDARIEYPAESTAHFMIASMKLFFKSYDETVKLFMAGEEKTRHLGCKNYPNCDTEGCGPKD